MKQSICSTTISNDTEETNEEDINESESLDGSDDDSNDEVVANGSTSEVGSIIEVEVTNITNFGVFVRCDDGEEGLIHISEVAMNLLPI